MGAKKAMGSIGVVRKLTTVQHIVTTAIMGALRTSATDIMEVHANLFPAELLLHRICHRATLRLAALPDPHPLYKLVRQATHRDIK